MHPHVREIIKKLLLGELHITLLDALVRVRRGA
jgi:hypothetical protein